MIKSARFDRTGRCRNLLVMLKLLFQLASLGLAKVMMGMRVQTLMSTEMLVVKQWCLGGVGYHVWRGPKSD